MKEDPLLFAGRVALVTGASHGIGAATARLLASLGAAVASATSRSTASASVTSPPNGSARPPAARMSSATQAAALAS